MSDYSSTCDLREKNVPGSVGIRLSTLAEAVERFGKGTRPIQPHSFARRYEVRLNLNRAHI